MHSPRKNGVKAAALALCFALQGTAIGMAAEKPVPAEKNPPGDIPDTQVFVIYKSPLGFQLKIPEGWARADLPNGARFSDKYGTIDLRKFDSTAAITAATLKAGAAHDLQSSVRAVTIKSIKEEKLPAGPAVLIAYTSNSDPNPVTNKQVRLENNRYIFFKNATEVTVDFAAPAGADNADQWQFMSRSFKWN